MSNQYKCCICRNTVPAERAEDNRKKSNLIYCGIGCSGFKRSNETVDQAARRWAIKHQAQSAIDDFNFGRLYDLQST